ncbi:F-box protein [Criblamydia sequanensis]|uniref:F-box domain-containing protein n=1 Tax=Candidatus Criblamydia sequanensis CRIB-18 TaxID=1437425 RepID=A0A090D3B8_9BACT|nr:F-box protein [Criblamydia sequanensis]CDR35108.1 F-box domain-containing protein [Criblamydia sequanensis CRIB-18]
MNNLSHISHLQSLPIEVQTGICSKLKKRDLAILGATSKHFNGLLEDDLFWKSDKVMPSFQPGSSKKDRLLQTYRAYCQFFSSHYPELKKEASSNIFEQKKRTDEFLSNLIQEVDFREFMGNIILEKPEIMNVVDDLVLNLPPSALANILSNSIKNSPQTRTPRTPLNIIAELKIDFKNWPGPLHDKIMQAAEQYNPNLIFDLYDRGLEPGRL